MSSLLEMSVIICTRNRSVWLQRALGSVLEGAPAGMDFEVLVVDGNSTDGTREAVMEIAVRDGRVRYENCPEPGLPRARVFGAERARGRVIGYFDDDAIACPRWISIAASIAAERDPVCFGGPFAAFYDDPKPDWFLDEYGSFSHGTESRSLGDDEFLCGGNIFFRRDALAEAGGFDAEFVGAKETYAYGEETVPQIRVRKQFPEEKFYYDPELSIRHLVRPSRMTLAAQCREAYELGRGYGRILVRDSSESRWFPFIRRMLGRLLCFCAAALAGRVVRDRIRFPKWEQFVIDRAHEHLRSAGVFFECWSAAMARGQTNA